MENAVPPQNKNIVKVHFAPDKFIEVKEAKDDAGNIIPNIIEPTRNVKIVGANGLVMSGTVSAFWTKPEQVIEFFKANPGKFEKVNNVE